MTSQPQRPQQTTYSRHSQPPDAHQPSGTRQLPEPQPLFKRFRSLLPWGRLLISFAAICIQMAIIILTVLNLSRTASCYYSAFALLSVACAILVWNSDINTSYKLTWIFLILIFPLYGGILFIINGIPKANRLGFRRFSQRCRPLKQSLFQPNHARLQEQAAPAQIWRQAQHLTATTLYPAYTDTHTTYFNSGESQFEAMLADLRQARQFIFIEFFIISEGMLWDTFFELLKTKVREGVVVRIIYDDIGSMWKRPRHLHRRLAEIGVQIRVFNPIMALPSLIFNTRDHRKLVVIDGHIAYTGGTNLADEYINAIERFGHWKDAGLRLAGEATWSFTVMFLFLWQHLSGKRAFHPSYFEQYRTIRPTGILPELNRNGCVMPYDDVPDDGLAVGANVYKNLINRAERSISIMTPYLVLDDEMLQALYRAAESGVDIKIITPHIPDKAYVHAVTRSYYKQLIEHGIRIYEYQPGFIHSKVVLADDELAVVGTVNFDYRSFYLHMECGAWMYRTTCIPEIRADFDQTLAASIPFTAEICRQWRLNKRIGQWFLRFFAPIL